MWNCCKKIDYLTDESKKKLVEIIPNTKNYFGDDIDDYNHLYEEIEEYLSDVIWSTETILHVPTISTTVINDTLAEIRIIYELMCEDQQNDMVKHICKLHMILCNIRARDVAGANDTR